MTSQMRYDSSIRFIARRLISGVSFMSIIFIVFKKRRGGGGGGKSKMAAMKIQDGALETSYDITDEV